MSETGSGAELETKRFVITKEESARNKLEVFKKALRDAQAAHPEILGATLYGSLTKDTAHSDSDVDSFVFVDLDQAKATFTPEDYKWAKAEVEKDPSLKNFYLEDLIAARKYGPMLAEPLKAIGLPEEKTRDIRVRVLSKQVIEDAIIPVAQRTQEILEYKKENEVQYQNGDWQNYDKYYAWKNEHPRPEAISLDWRIASMFHLAIGRQRLQPYRQVAIDTLRRYGETGEEVWREDVIGRTADLERNFQGSNYSHLYPQSLAAAEKYFHLKSNSVPVTAKSVSSP